MRNQTAKNFLGQLRAKALETDSVSITNKELAYKCGIYHLWRLATEIKPGQPILLIRAGIHGDEIAGPLSVLEYFEQIIEYSSQRDVALVIYPLGNPSGFECGTRYNRDNDKGDFGNNDAVRYEMPDGSFIDDLGKEKKQFVSWTWSDSVPDARLSRESKVFLTMLRQEPLSQIAGCLDLHQDYLTPTKLSAAYHYSFGDLTTYSRIVAEIGNVMPILKNTPIGVGFNIKIDEISTDDNGFIVRHDGSLPDLFWRLGAPFCVTSETTGPTPLAKAILVNKIWIFGIIDLICARTGLV